MQGEKGKPDKDKRLDLSFTRSTKDMAVAGLVGAVIAALLIGVVYFTFRGDVAVQSRTVAEVDARLTRKVKSLEMEVEALRGLPDVLRREMEREALDEMARKAAFLGSQIKDPKRKKKLVQISNLLRELSARPEAAGAN